jgi:mitogen-activated protein kinase organizer 1
MTLSEAKDSVSCVVVIQSEILAGSVDGRVRTYDVRMGKLTTDVFGGKLAITGSSTADSDPDRPNNFHDIDAKQ